MKAINDYIIEMLVNVVWNHKIHEHAANRFYSLHVGIKNTQIVLSAISASGLIVVLTGQLKNDSTLVYGYLSLSIVFVLIPTILTASKLFLELYTKDFDYSARSQQHVKSANEFRRIREEIKLFIVEIKTKKLENQELLNQIKVFSEMIQNANQQAPRTNRKDVLKAQKSLKKEGDSRVDVGEARLLISKHFLFEEDGIQEK